MLNVESFAFVLALDEEVIERGIGHRYQAYNFAGKKPEMPITGFEYLEKIVHIPFRLPALSSVDAMSYIRLLEAGLLKSNKEVTPPSDGPWFAGWMLNVARGHKSEFDIKNGEDVNFSDGNPTDENLRRTTTLVTRDFNLTHFVLYCFDAYVPRKLVRLVELFYQIERIAITRQRRFSKQLGGEMDIRIIATLLMLQLFQPELYRAIKRSGTGLGEILRAFQHADGLKNPVSNMDLLRWASFEAKDKLPATTLKSAMIRIGQLTDDPGQRHPALQVRLPIVACLMEHRQAHRHAFDPMKMFQILTESIKQVPLQGGDITEFDAKRYFGLFSKNWDTADTMLGLASSTRTNEMSKTYERDIDSSPESKPTSPVEVFTQIQEIVLQDVNALFLLMVKDDTSAKAIMQTTGLKRGQKIKKKLLVNSIHN